MIAMPFGKFTGVPFDQVDVNYLDWLLTLDNLRPWLRKAIEVELSQRVEQGTHGHRDVAASVLSPRVDPDMAQAIIVTGY